MNQSPVPPPASSGQAPVAAPAAGGAPTEGAARPTVVVPPWIQLVGLPLLVIFCWGFATAASHAVVVFLIAGIISLMLNPLVRAIVIRGVPRPIAVMVVFAAFVAILVLLSAALINLTVHQAEQLQQNLPGYTHRAEQKVNDLQQFIDRRGLDIDLRDQGIRFLAQLEQKSSEISTNALTYGRDFVRTFAGALFNVVLVVVVTVYMLLDAPRIARFVSGSLPANSNADALFRRMELALLNYVRGQTMASLVMGASAAVGLWVIGVTGIWPQAADLAIVLGLIVAITEFAPSIGPALGSIPPIVGALFEGVVPALVVLVFFLVLHQVEGHIVIPKLMGAAIAVHPLLVIFGIVAGAQIMGAGGIVLALPVLALGREIVAFLHERVALQRWPAGAVNLPHAVHAAAGGSAAAATEPPAEAPAERRPAARAPSGGRWATRWQRIRTWWSVDEDGSTGGR